jgi:hypothetical protein
LVPMDAQPKRSSVPKAIEHLERIMASPIRVAPFGMSRYPASTDGPCGNQL